MPFFFRIIINAVTHISTDSSEPKVEARPMGKRVSVKNFEARYAPGTRTSTMERKL